ncbi:MAG: transcriptional repressor NrdR [Planctomycetes bacterium]|nr:transcriptional repressor NrdR [Planctomycetota bacterium]
MNCPYCKDDNDRVVDTRSSDHGTSVRRRRECLSCGRRFTSHETVEYISVTVMKKDGKKENFDIQKVIKSVEIACRKRPITVDQIKELADMVERKSMDIENKAITSRAIGDLIMSELKKLDMVAFVRFSSVYQEYQDVDQFILALNQMKSKPSD